MLRLTVTLLGLAAVVLSTPQHHSSRGKDYDTQNRGVKSVFIDRDEPVIPQEYSDAHATFSLNILKNPYFTQTLEKYGAVSVSPFSFGHALALVGEKQYKDIIPKIVNLPTIEKVTEAYTLQAEAHEDDHKAYVTAQYYSPKENVATEGQTRLGLHVQNLPFREQAPSLINSHVRVATQDRIVDALVPNVPLLNEDTTKSVVLNTFHYQNYFEQEFLNVGKKPFTGLGGKVVDAEAVEVIGSFPVYETPEFYAVAFPLESDGIDKHAVFVLPKTGVKEYLNSPAVETVFKAPPKFWVYKTIRVQVPKINITLAHNVEQYITPENNIVCLKDQPIQLQPIVQITNILVDREEISYAVTTGSHFTTVQPTRSNVATSSKTQRSGPTTTAQYKLTPQQYVPAKENYLTVDQLVFNKPFFTYFYETTYGPFGYTAVSHVLTTPAQVQVPTARHHDNPFDFSDATRQSRWTCEEQHEH